MGATRLICLLQNLELVAAGKAVVQRCCWVARQLHDVCNNNMTVEPAVRLLT